MILIVKYEVISLEILKLFRVWLLHQVEFLNDAVGRKWVCLYE